MPLSALRGLLGYAAKRWALTWPVVRGRRAGRHGRGWQEPAPAAAAGQADRSACAPGAIDAWFTEGFDTAALQKAKALLAELVG